MIRFGPT